MTRCPECRSDLRSCEIPELLRTKYYGGRTHYTRLIGIYSTDRDATVAWRCPDCGHTEAHRQAFESKE